MSKRNFTCSMRPLLNAFIYISLLFFITGCKEDNSNSTQTADTHQTQNDKALLENHRLLKVSGVAMKGTIINGVVTLYGLEQQNGYYQVSDQPLGNTRTDQHGHYNLEVQIPRHNQGVIMRVSADPFTTMICDVPIGCKGTSRKINFGDALSLNLDFEMFASHTANSNAIEVNITPLSHLAHKWAEAQNAGLSPENITAAHRHIETLFDLPANTLAAAPIDLSKLTQSSSASLEQIQYGLVAASFQALADTSPWVDIVDLLSSAGQRIAETGTLTSVNLGALPEVSRSDLFYAAQHIAMELATSLSPTSTSHSQRSVSTQTLGRAQIIEHLRQLASSYGASTTRLLISSTNQEPLRITFQPSSASIQEQESLTLNVNALGSEPIRYQWRKDGQPIPQATSEHYVLTAPTTQDSGHYDCIVSNNDGSILSKVAVVEVKPRVSPLLTWEPPTVRLDGSPLHLSELRGYRILYGLSKQQLDRQVLINDPYTTQFKLSGLQGSTYFFAIQAIDEQDNESSLSEVIKVTL